MSFGMLYLLTRSEHLLNLFTVFMVVSLIVLIIFSCLAVAAKFDENSFSNEDKKFIFSNLKSAASIAIIFSLLVQLVPSNKDLYMMIGGYYITNNEQVKKLPDNALKAANDFLEKFDKDTNHK